MPGARISSAHGTVRPVDPATGAPDASAMALYHPAAAFRQAALKETMFEDIAGAPDALLRSRERRADRRAARRRRRRRQERRVEPRWLPPLTPWPRHGAAVAVMPEVTTLAGSSSLAEAPSVAEPVSTEVAPEAARRGRRGPEPDEVLLTMPRLDPRHRSPRATRSCASSRSAASARSARTCTSSSTATRSSSSTAA